MELLKSSGILVKSWGSRCCLYHRGSWLESTSLFRDLLTGRTRRKEDRPTPSRQPIPDIHWIHLKHALPNPLLTTDYFRTSFHRLIHQITLRHQIRL